MTEQQRADHERIRRELWAAIYRQEHEHKSFWVDGENRADQALRAFDKRFAALGVPASDALAKQEHATDIASAFSDLPDQLRAHPGVKRLYRCGVRALGVEMAPAPDLAWMLPAMRHMAKDLPNNKATALLRWADAIERTCGVPGPNQTNPPLPRDLDPTVPHGEGDSTDGVAVPDHQTFCTPESKP